MFDLSRYYTQKRAQGLAVNSEKWTTFSYNARRPLGCLSSCADWAEEAFGSLESVDQADSDAEAMTRELFTSLFEREPESSAKPVKWAQTALDIASELPEFQALKEVTVGDGDCSALATNEILDAILDDVVALREAQAQHEEQQQQGQGQAGEGAGEAGDEAGEPQEGEGQGNGQSQGNGNGEDPNGEIDGDDPNASDEWEPSDELIDNLRASMRSASNKAREEAQELSEALSGAGSDKGSNARDQIDRSQLAQKLTDNKRLARLLRMAGRMQQLDSAKPAKSKENGFEIGEVVLSSDLNNLIPSELVQLAGEETSDLFLKRYLEDQLFTVKRKGKEPLGRGNVIVCVDQSGSMSGTRNDMARAFVVASVELMRKDKRNTTVIGYESCLRDVHSFQSKYKTATINGRAVSWSKAVADLAQVEASGGTSFDPALRQAIKELGKDERADLIFVTDGDASVSSSLIKKLEEAKEAKGLRVTTVLIGGGLSNAVQAVSDEVHTISELTEESFAKVIGGARAKTTG